MLHGWPGVAAVSMAALERTRAGGDAFFVTLFMVLLVTLVCYFEKCGVLREKLRNLHKHFLLDCYLRKVETMSLPDLYEFKDALPQTDLSLDLDALQGVRLTKDTRLTDEAVSEVRACLMHAIEMRIGNLEQAYGAENGRRPKTKGK